MAGFNTGSFNTAVGSGAMELLSKKQTGSENTAVGTGTLGASTLIDHTGSGNTAVGSFTLSSNRSGSNNIAVGTDALGGNLDDSNNTVVGFDALSLLQFFDRGNNIAIGHEAGLNLRGGSNNIYLSARGMENESDTIRIGRNQAQTFIAGIGGVVMGGPAARTVVINPTTLQLGVAPVTPSSARYKQDIETMGIRSQGLLQLRPVTFRYKQDEQGQRQYGLIAE